MVAFSSFEYVGVQFRIVIFLHFFKRDFISLYRMLIKNLRMCKAMILNMLN